MKKFITLGIAFLLLSITTGCTKCTYNIEVKNENITINSVKSFNRQKIDSYNTKIWSILEKQIDKILIEPETNGYLAQKYNDGVYEGIQYSKKVRLEKFSKNDLPYGFRPIRKQPMTFYKGLIKDTYEINLMYDVKKVIEQDINNTALQIDQSLIKPDILELTIKIPSKAIEHNATSVLNKKEYKWVLNPYGESRIYIAYEKTDFANIIILLSLFSLIIWAIIKLLKIRNTNNW